MNPATFPTRSGALKARVKQLANQISAVKHTVDVTFGPELSHPLLPPSFFLPSRFVLQGFFFHQKKSVLILESTTV